MGKACRQLKDGMDVSGHPRLNEAGTVVVVFDDGTEWLPPLIPPDLTKFAAAGGSVPNKVVKAKAKQAASKPVEDYVLETIRAKCKSSPIIKVEARVDRHDLSSAWRQKMQIVVKSEGGMTPTVAMNICMTFCDCYHNMNLNPGRLNFKECKDNLILMHQDGTHNFADSKMEWQLVSKQMKKAFPPPPTILLLQLM